MDKEALHQNITKNYLTADKLRQFLGFNLKAMRFSLSAFICVDRRLITVDSHYTIFLEKIG